jgi:hypothetical protein
VTEQISRPATLEDLKTLLRSLNANGVDYLLTGGYAPSPLAATSARQPTSILFSRPPPLPASARGVFTSVSDLKRKLMRYIRQYNKNPKPIKWKYDNPSKRIRCNSSGSVD